MYLLDQTASYKSRTAESLLVGRLDGSLCWLQVTVQDLDLLVKRTELSHCYRDEGEEKAAYVNWIMNINV